MAFKKSVNVAGWDREQLKTLQAGQWVRDEPLGDKGVYCGVHPSGIPVVAWYRNAATYESFNAYLKVMMDYTNGVFLRKVEEEMKRGEKEEVV